MMSLFTNDLETVQDCFGSGILSFCDALFLGLLAISKMANMNLLLTFFALIPMGLLLTGNTYQRTSLQYCANKDILNKPKAEEFAH